MKKILYSLLIIPLLASCTLDMDLSRSDTMTSTQLKDDAGAAVYTTDGNYSLFKDQLEYNGSVYSGNTYIRHYFQMSEFRGDNVCLSGRTEDPLYEAMCYCDNQTLYNLSYFWYVAYKIIYGANSNIESIKEGSSATADQLLGENYCLRAIAHMHLNQLYGHPYSQDREKLSVVLRNSTDCSVTKRATVGEVYDQIVADLEKAAKLMKDGKPRGDAGYISYNTARGLLTRAYLHMGMNQKCVDLADEMLGPDPSSHLDSNLADYYKNAATSKETLWCVSVNPVDFSDKRSSIASMYYSTSGTGGDGWGEMYYSDPLIELYERYPQDKRFTSFFSLYGKIDGQKMIHWPVENGTNDFRANMLKDVDFDAVAGKYYFTEGSTKYYVETEKPHTYDSYYIQNFDGKAKTKVYLRDRANRATGVRNTYPMYYMSKFSWQDNEPMIASPVMIRWAEVILNRAEANAKRGEGQKALNDVNVIRNRAGLTDDAEMTLENYSDRGYANVLEVVLDERRLELCFEGFRAQDIYRNGLSLDRRFAGVQTWEVVEPTDNRIPFRIPFDEVSVSGIEQNQ